MKNLTLVIVLSMAAVAGCKKKDDSGATAGSSGSAMASGSAPAAGSGSAMAAGSGSAPAAGKLDCATAFNHAVDLEKEHMKKDMPTVTDEQVAKIREVGVKRCVDDKWTDDALHCFNDAKTADEGDHCDDKLTKEQKDKFNAEMETVMSAMMGSGAGSGAAPVADELPKECQDYKAAMDKLGTCEKLPAATKDGLMQGYKAMSEGWANAGALPPEAKKAMSDGCKQGADALMKAAKTVCGW